MIDLVISYFKLRKFEKTYRKVAMAYISKLIDGKRIANFDEIDNLDMRNMLDELFAHKAEYKYEPFKEDNENYYYVDKDDKTFNARITNYLEKQIAAHRKKWHDSHLSQIQGFYFFAAFIFLILLPYIIIPLWRFLRSLFE